MYIYKLVIQQWGESMKYTRIEKQLEGNLPRIPQHVPPGHRVVRAFGSLWIFLYFLIFWFSNQVTKITIPCTWDLSMGQHWPALHALQRRSHSGLTTALCGMCYKCLLLPFRQLKNWGSESWSNLPKVTQLSNGGAKIQTMVNLIPEQRSWAITS